MPSVLSCAYDVSTANAEFDQHNLGRYEIGFIVTTDGLMGPQSVANGALLSSPHPLPSLWSTYSYQGDVDNFSWARGYTVRRDPDSRKLYYVQVKYLPLEPGEGSQTESEDPVESEPNPLDRAPVVWWDREVTTELVTRDIDGKTIRNKCEDYYPEEDEIEKPKGILVVEKNVATLGEVVSLSRTFDNAVNGSPWSIGGVSVPSRAAKCNQVSSSAPCTEAGYTYFRVVFRFSFAEDGKTWDLLKSELGRFHWTKTAGGSYEMFKNRRAVTDAKKIVGLADDGTRLDDGQPLTITAWRVRREANFNTLPF